MSYNKRTMNYNKLTMNYNKLTMNWLHNKRLHWSTGATRTETNLDSPLLSFSILTSAMECQEQCQFIIVDVMMYIA